MENRAVYGVDPYEELKSLMQPDEAGQLVKLLRLVKDLGGWGEVRLPFKRARLCRATVTVSPVEEENHQNDTSRSCNG